MDRSLYRQKGRDVLISLAILILKTWFRTCRIRIIHEEFHKEFFLGTRQFVGVTWHRASIFFVFFYGPFHPLVMFSQSQDGEYLARFAQRCGVIPVRGSSTRGGERALIQMIHHMRAGSRICSTVLDGPQGPRFKAKKGLLLLAQKSGVPLLPFMWSARKPLTLEKTWDKTMIPRPFSEVVITYGEPLYVPADGDSHILEALQKELEDRLNGLMIEVDQICDYKTRWG